MKTNRQKHIHICIYKLYKHIYLHTYMCTKAFSVSLDLFSLRGHVEGLSLSVFSKLLVVLSRFRMQDPRFSA